MCCYAIPKKEIHLEMVFYSRLYINSKMDQTEARSSSTCVLCFVRFKRKLLRNTWHNIISNVDYTRAQYPSTILDTNRDWCFSGLSFSVCVFLSVQANNQLSIIICPSVDESRHKQTLIRFSVVLIQLVFHQRKLGVSVKLTKNQPIIKSSIIFYR